MSSTSLDLDLDLEKIPDRSSLGPEEVHLWRFNLDRSPAELERLFDVLAPDERDRVARFHFQRDRHRALAARGVLRVLLGRYLGQTPASLVFEVGAYGKPSLAGSPIQFNLSHSGDVGLCGISTERPLGVDVEQIRSEIDHAELARHSFSAAEQAELAPLPRPLAQRAFFRCWSMKEAYIKGRGGGLSIPLDGFDVPLAASTRDEPRAVISREQSPDAHGWYVRDVDLDPKFAAAVAVRAPRWTIRLQSFDLTRP